MDHTDLNAEKRIIIADMHVHSENSNDSSCPLEEMVKAQIERGTTLMAVTDHFHVTSYPNTDIFAPITNACRTACELNQKYGSKCLILSGAEVGEGIWNPAICDKLQELWDYDVIIGSVHLVRHPGMEDYYSRMNFSKLSADDIYQYMHSYFDDVLEMLETVDFDILAHLTCPLRYITGYHHVDLDLSVYEEKITTILKRIIEKNISLEINTSSYDILKDFMPTKDIIKKYYEMGGYLVTLGSDAHVTRHASIHFEKAVSCLKEIGFKNIYYYKERKAWPVSIEMMINRFH